jgi:hypothetical protein
VMAAAAAVVETTTIDSTITAAAVVEAAVIAAITTAVDVEAVAVEVEVVEEAGAAAAVAVVNKRIGRRKPNRLPFSTRDPMFPLTAVRGWRAVAKNSTTNRKWPVRQRPKRERRRRRKIENDASCKCKHSKMPCKYKRLPVHTMILTVAVAIVQPPQPLQEEVPPQPDQGLLWQYQQVLERRRPLGEEDRIGIKAAEAVAEAAMRDATSRKVRGERLLRNSKVVVVVEEEAEETAVVAGEENMGVVGEETVAVGPMVKTFSKLESRNSIKLFKRQQERP